LDQAHHVGQRLTGQEGRAVGAEGYRAEAC